eukprot:TRINITY_DN6914_c0_g1_i3.p1 TRINITY_DN6914_c0_g1~~TRINITY_DN6914_c0_g1_i3.p1  ORF type:complete len:406 (+),score=76.25 TRINITY_DN6914_c0_g1_i3:28-1218(+)
MVEPVEPDDPCCADVSKLQALRCVPRNFNCKLDSSCCRHFLRAFDGDIPPGEYVERSSHDEELVNYTQMRAIAAERLLHPLGLSDKYPSLVVAEEKLGIAGLMKARCRDGPNPGLGKQLTDSRKSLPTWIQPPAAASRTAPPRDMEKPAAEEIPQRAPPASMLSFGFPWREDTDTVLPSPEALDSARLAAEAATAARAAIVEDLSKPAQDEVGSFLPPPSFDTSPAKAESARLADARERGVPSEFAGDVALEDKGGHVVSLPHPDDKPVVAGFTRPSDLEPPADMHEISAAIALKDDVPIETEGVAMPSSPKAQLLQPLPRAPGEPLASCLAPEASPRSDSPGAPGRSPSNRSVRFEETPAPPPEPRRRDVLWHLLPDTSHGQDAKSGRGFSKGVR